MPRSRASRPNPDRVLGLAFLLSQVGSHASARFAERLLPLGLAPPHVGILSVMQHADGLTQQALGEKLGVFPSRLVGLLDELEEKGLVERRNNPADRRSYALYLTDGGRATIEQVGRLACDHQDALCAALDPAEQAQLASFLRRIADQQNLTPGVHPGFRKLGGGDAK